jgi:hypothetical protein
LPHVLLLVAPTAAEYDPAAQLMHTLFPLLAEYFPAGHLLHVLLLAAPTAAEYDPAAQLMQMLAA